MQSWRRADFCICWQRPDKRGIWEVIPYVREVIMKVRVFVIKVVGTILTVALWILHMVSPNLWNLISRENALFFILIVWGLLSLTIWDELPISS